MTAAPQTGEVVVTSWGDGQATIDGANGSSLRANGCNYLIVRNLRLIGSGRKNGNTQDGLWVLDSQGLEIDRVEVSGFRGSGLAGGWRAGGPYHQRVCP